MYYSYYYSNQINDRLIVSNIDDQQYKSISDFWDVMNSVSYQIDYFIMMYMNYRSFIDLYKTVPCSDSLQFVRYNASYISFLNSYYTWWEYIKKHNLCNEEISCIMESYKHIKTCKYVHCFRNNSVHNSQIIKNIEVDMLANKKNLYIDVEGIIANNNTGRNLAELLLADSPIEAKVFAYDVIKVLNEMMREVYLSEKPYLDSAVKYIMQFLPEGLLDRYNTVICSDDKMDVLPIGWIFKLFDEKIKIYDQIYTTIIDGL